MQPHQHNPLIAAEWHARPLPEGWVAAILFWTTNQDGKRVKIYSNPLVMTDKQGKRKPLPRSRHARLVRRRR